MNGSLRLPFHNPDQPRRQAGTAPEALFSLDIKVRSGLQGNLTGSAVHMGSSASARTRPSRQKTMG